MIALLSALTFGAAVLLYGAASALFYLDVARVTARSRADDDGPPARPRHFAAPPTLLTAAALGHAGYVALASFVAHVCPIHSVHFLLSVASLFASAAYLTLRSRFRIDALGILVAPLGLAFLLGTFFLGKPEQEPRLSPVFITLHVVANLLGVSLFLLAGGAATLYLVQERRIKEKRRALRGSNLPALDTLDAAEQRFLVAGFPLLTLGIITGTYWAQKLETGSPEEVMRTIFGYATWFLIGGVLLLRAAAGWRGRRSAYGTILGLACAAAVLVMYIVRPAGDVKPDPSRPRPVAMASRADDPGRPQGEGPRDEARRP
jgi:ABC-type uncharacterized transport system permease subunit